MPDLSNLSNLSDYPDKEEILIYLFWDKGFMGLFKNSIKTIIIYMFGAK